MHNNPGTDPAALGCTVVALRMALEETLTALTEKNGNQVGEWLDEVQELALLRAKAHLTKSGRRRGCPRRPPTPPCVGFPTRRFMIRD